MAIINKETIISAFDDKMTLLQWLKKLEKVLDTSTLANIRTIKVANTQYKIVLSFEDGTTIESDIIQLQSEIAGIQLQNGHLIFTLINGNTIDAGLIDVSNLGNTTIYGTFEVADGNATFGANVEIDGTLKVNSTLQVGDTTTNDDELAKLPRTLLTPIDTPSEQELVLIDTTGAQKNVKLGESLYIENDTIEANKVVDYTNLMYITTGTANEGFSYLKLYYQNKKLHFIIEGNFTTNEDGSLAFGVNTQNLPINIREKIFRRDGTNLTQNPSTTTSGGEIITRIPICLGLTTDFYETTAETANYYASSTYSTILIKRWNVLSPNTSYALSLRFELAII